MSLGGAGLFQFANLLFGLGLAEFGAVLFSLLLGLTARFCLASHAEVDDLGHHDGLSGCSIARWCFAKRWEVGIVYVT